MTLQEAFAAFLESPEYKEASKGQTNEAIKYRTYKQRFLKGELKSGAMVEMLQAHGYEIKAGKASKKDSKK